MIKILTATIILMVISACDQQNSTATVGSSSIEHNEVVEGRGANTDNWWDQLPHAEWSRYPRLLESDPWFEVYQVFPNVYAIYEPGQFEEVISFLLVGEQRALLFDTGLGIAAIQPVVSQLTSLDILVVNSHSHYDHIGGNHEFKNIAAVDVPYAQQRALGLPSEQVAEYISGDWVWKPFPSQFKPSEYRIQAYTLTESIQDGSIINLGGRQLEVVHTPGHSPDSICLLDRDNRLLLTGDTFYLAPLYAHLDGSDLEQYMASADRLVRLQPSIDYLLTAHNIPVVDSAYLLELQAAFNDIKAGNGSYVEFDHSREYDFDEFSIITK